MKSWQETVMDTYKRCDALDELKIAAHYGEDIRWDRVSEVIAQAQAEISFKVGVNSVVRSLAPHYEEDLDGIFKQNGWWLADDILETIENGI